MRLHLAADAAASVLCSLLLASCTGCATIVTGAASALPVTVPPPPGRVLATFSQIPVPGTAVIFDPDETLSNSQLWNMAAGGPLDATPAVLAVRFSAQSGQYITLSASGLVACCTTADIGPDGQPGMPSDVVSLGSISGFFNSSRNGLVGVFTNGSPSGLAPANYSSSTTTVQTDLNPLLNQVFFVGDGLTGTGSGANQMFHAPSDATELWLGIVDTWGGPLPSGVGGYGDNYGSFQVSGELRHN